jgi:hypothetical protein
LPHRLGKRVFLEIVNRGDLRQAFPMNLTWRRVGLLGIAVAVGAVVNAQDGALSSSSSAESESNPTRSSRTRERIREWVQQEWRYSGTSPQSQDEGSSETLSFGEGEEGDDVLVLEKFEVWERRPIIIPPMESRMGHYIRTGLLAEKVGKRTTRRLTFSKQGGLRLTFSR